MTAKKEKRAKGVARVTSELRGAQREVEKMLRTVRKRVDSMLPAASRKGLERFEARVEKVQKDLEKARKRAVKEAETRARGVLDSVGHRAATVVKPLVANLDIATKSDVDRLRKRIQDLELRVHKSVTAHQAEHAA